MGVIFSATYFFNYIKDECKCIVLEDENKYKKDCLTCFEGKAIFKKNIQEKLCIEKDKEIDNSDGKFKGKVRWVKIRKTGPDTSVPK